MGEIWFGDNDLILGKDPIYDQISLQYGGKTWYDYSIPRLNSDSHYEIDILNGMRQCDTIRFILRYIRPRKRLFKKKIVPCDGSYIDWELQTILLTQELFEKTKWYMVDKAPHNSIYEYENLREISIQAFLKEI